MGFNSGFKGLTWTYSYSFCNVFIREPLLQETLRVLKL